MTGWGNVALLAVDIAQGEWSSLAMYGGVRALGLLVRASARYASLGVGYDGKLKSLPPSLNFYGSARKVAVLVEKAKKRYPKLAGRTHQHHTIPKYLGGSKDGPTVTINAAYQQLITNAFRKLWAYGQGKMPNAQELAEILQKVYNQYPLPP